MTAVHKPAVVIRQGAAVAVVMPSLPLRITHSYSGGVIALIDYGSGNLRSVHKSLLKVGADVRLAQRPDELADADAVVLPGVGAFDDCLQALERQALLQATREFINSGRPFLGICVGYQALFEKSEEFNSCAAGLGRVQGQGRAFRRRERDKSSANRLEPARNRPRRLSTLQRHTKRQLRLFRSQFFSETGRFISRGHPHRATAKPCLISWKDNGTPRNFTPRRAKP